jgi:hypothetical protein
MRNPNELDALVGEWVEMMKPETGNLKPES